MQKVPVYLAFICFALTFAPVTGTSECDAPRVYTKCGPACPQTCFSDPSQICITVCVPGCFCPSYAPVFHRGKCITRDQCPARVDGDESRGEPYYGFCKLPSSILRRVVAIWSPDQPTGRSSTSCPKDYPYPMYGGQWCCHYAGRLDYKKKYANSKYYHCDGYSCCKNDGSLKRCPHDYGYGCTNSANFWKLPPNYNPYYGDSKNIGTSNHGAYHYDNVNGIDLLREGDYVVVQCDSNQYKAFVCDEPEEKWYKDCRYQTDDLRTDEINFFVPRHLRLETARVYCKSHQGTLATIRSEVDNKHAAKVMLMRGQGNQCAFIGFTDEVNNGYWRWMNGKDVTYTNWAYHRTDRGWDQPNDGFGYGEEDYAVMCRYPNSYQNRKNEFKWFDVGPPRNYYGSTVNFELAYSFCTTTANFVGAKKNCKRPTRPCGGSYTKKSKKGIIEHGKFHLIKCNRGYRIQGSGRISCNNGVTTDIPKCIKIRYAYDGTGSSGGTGSAPRVHGTPSTADLTIKRPKKNCVGDDDGPNYPVYDGDNNSGGNYGGNSGGDYGGNSGGDSIPRNYAG